MVTLKKFSERYLDVNLDRSEARHNLAKACHDELEKCLTGKQGYKPLRTFFDIPRVQQADPQIAQGQDDQEIVPEKEKSFSENLNEGDISDLRFSSLDLIAYAFLKEELVNTGDSAEVKYLKQKCPNLMNFVKSMDFLF